MLNKIIILINLIVVVSCIWACSMLNVVDAIFYLIFVLISVSIITFFLKANSLTILVTIAPIFFAIFLLILAENLFEENKTENLFEENKIENSIFLTILFCFICFVFVIFSVAIIFMIITFFHLKIESIPLVDYIYNYEYIYLYFPEMLVWGWNGDLEDLIRLLLNLYSILLSILLSLCNFLLSLCNFLVGYIKRELILFGYNLYDILDLLSSLDEMLYYRFDKYVSLKLKLSYILSYIYSSWVFQFTYPYFEFILLESVKYVQAASNYLIQGIDLIKTIDFSSLMKTDAITVISLIGDFGIHVFTIGELVIFLMGLVLIGVVIGIAITVELVERYLKKKDMEVF